MGDRALIIKDGNNTREFWVATHWDGMPKYLGKTLQKIKGKSEPQKLHILHVEHTVDFYFPKNRTIKTNPSKPFKKLVFNKPDPMYNKHKPEYWYYDYYYWIKRNGRIYYIKVNKMHDRTIDLTNIDKYEWSVINH